MISDTLITKNDGIECKNRSQVVRKSEEWVSDSKRLKGDPSEKTSDYNRSKDVLERSD